MIVAIPLARVKTEPHIEIVIATPLPSTSCRDLLVPGPGRSLRCVACAHRCALRDGAAGVCRVRRRSGDALDVPWGYVAGVAVDPVEKKPFYHLLPGTRTLSFGMLGCDLHCPFCQNWFTSQSLRDPHASRDTTAATPRRLVELALDHHCAGITSTYNEPLITAEWAREVFREAREAGLTTSMVSNGHATSEVLEYLAPVLDAMKVDLKCFSERGYRTLGGRLQPVVDTITTLASSTIWIEVVTLLIPGFNDSPEELSAAAEFLAATDIDMPWHLTVFHPDYRMTDHGPTPMATLDTAMELGRQAGLHYVYGGNLGDMRPDLEHTRCFHCGELLITRQGFTVTSVKLCDGACPTCGTGIAGIWLPC